MKLHHMVWPLLVFLLIWTGWVSGEVTSSFSASDGESSVGFSTVYGARLEDRISDDATASFGGTLGLSRNLQVSGDLHESHFVNDAANDLYAGVAVDVWNADDSIYKYVVYPGEGEVGPHPYVQAKQSLTSVNADGIQLVIEASNPWGYARGDLISNGGTVQGYVGTARATADYSTISQSVEHLDALPEATTSLSTKAETWSLASSGEGLQAWDEQLFGAEQTLQVEGGSLDSYAASSTAWLDRATSTLTSAEVSVPEGWSKLEVGSSNLQGHFASVQTDLFGGEGSMKAFGLADGTQALVKDELSLECGAEGSIGHLVESSNQNGDSSSSTLEVLGGSGPANLELTGHARSNDDMAQIWQDLSTSALQGSITQDVEATTFGCSTAILPDGTVISATDYIEIVNGDLADEFVARAAYGGDGDAMVLIDVDNLNAKTVDTGSGTSIIHDIGAVTGDELSVSSSTSLVTQGCATATLMPMSIGHGSDLQYIGRISAGEYSAWQQSSRSMYSTADPNCITITSEANSNGPDSNYHVSDQGHTTGSVGLSTTGYYSANPTGVKGTTSIDAYSWAYNPNNGIYWARIGHGEIDDRACRFNIGLETEESGEDIWWKAKLDSLVTPDAVKTVCTDFEANGRLTVSAEASNGENHGEFKVNAVGMVDEVGPYILSSTYDQARLGINGLHFEGRELFVNIGDDISVENPLASSGVDLTDAIVDLSGYIINSGTGESQTAKQQLYMSGSAGSLETTTNAYIDPLWYCEVTFEAENVQQVDLLLRSFRDIHSTEAYQRANVLAEYARWYAEASKKPDGMPDFDSGEMVEIDPVSDVLGYTWAWAGIGAEEAQGTIFP